MGKGRPGSGNVTGPHRARATSDLQGGRDLGRADSAGALAEAGVGHGGRGQREE